MKKSGFLIIILALVVSGLAYSSNEQIFPTGMRITVLSRLGNPVENAKVTVYSNREDYESEENAIAGPAFTDKKGRVTFKNLEEKQYFVQVIKGDESNYGDAEQTGKLKKGKINKFNIVIQ
jgi:uncharacterized GH25 family protein